MTHPWHGYDEIIDVRSPSEYVQDHIPDACNLPALSDDERAAIGKLHQQSPFVARRRGAGMVAENIARHLREHLAERPPHWRPLIYCWRGGQRSGAVTEVLRRVGWDAQQLIGGYKHYRNVVMRGIVEHAKAQRWLVIGGKTGAGKTLLLRQLAASGAQTVDLESLCNHRGSAFGGKRKNCNDRNNNAEEFVQPSQRRFESLLFARLAKLSPTTVFIESESRKIGALHIPPALLSAIRRAPAIYINADLASRAEHIAAEYHDMRETKNFTTALESIINYTGAKRARLWQEMHAAQQWQQLAADMLESFYDVGYQKSLAANYSNQAAVFTANPNCAQSMQNLTQELIMFAQKMNTNKDAAFN